MLAVSDGAVAVRKQAMRVPRAQARHGASSRLGVFRSSTRSTLAQLQSLAAVTGALAYLTRLFMQRGLLVSAARQLFRLFGSLALLAAEQRDLEIVVYGEPVACTLPEALDASIPQFEAHACAGAWGTRVFLGV
jgi:hypothetical protein